MKYKRKNINNLHWFVINENCMNIDKYDVFTHTTFKDDVLNTIKKVNSFKEFKEKLIRWVKYYFWGKCEYEVLVCGWPPTPDRREEIKLDVSSQIEMNYDIFCEYIWSKLEVYEK